ncbi:hypothetical protein HAX54_006309, partial [Datura stramonium]|nr:hypothetical protein [Datura stramonium]
MGLKLPIVPDKTLCAALLYSSREGTRLHSYRLVSAICVQPALYSGEMGTHSKYQLLHTASSDFIAPEVETKNHHIVFT